MLEVKIRSYNLVPGCVISDDGSDAAVIEEVTRDVDLETVRLVFTDGMSSTYDFNHEVDLIGIDPGVPLPGENIDLGFVANDER